MKYLIITSSALGATCWRMHKAVGDICWRLAHLEEDVANYLTSAVNTELLDFIWSSKGYRPNGNFFHTANILKRFNNHINSRYAAYLVSSYNTLYSAYYIE